MALKYSITHNGNTWNSTTNLDTINLSNGSVTSSITTAGTTTLNCAGKVADNNLVIGDKTLNCAGKIMSGNVSILSEVATCTITYSLNSGGTPGVDVKINGTEYSGSGTLEVAPGAQVKFYANGVSRVPLRNATVYLNGTSVASEHNLLHTGVLMYTYTVTSNIKVTSSGGASVECYITTL